MTQIATEQLTKAFNGMPVLNGLNLSVPEGAVYGLLGRNGAGKTTLLKLAMGLLVPDKGHVVLLGQKLPTDRGEARLQIAYVAEQGLLPVWMSVRQVVRFEASVCPSFDADRVERYLAKSTTDDSRSVRTLSKGQRRRLDLELALARRPRVLLLDEPFDGLDPVSRTEAIETLVTHLSDCSTTVVVSSHVLTDLERISDRIGILAGGKIAFESDLDALKESVTVVFGPAPRLPIAADVVAGRADQRGFAFVVRGLGADEEATLRHHGFQLSRPGLEELGVELLRCLSSSEEL
jgi:ABC-2 type transport system ATP-binding protein